MSGYIYKNSQPFRQVLRYDYADCASQGFINDWKQSRKNFYSRLRTGEGDDFNCNEIAHHSILYWLGKAKDREDLVWIFIKKFEVFGKLHSHYGEDLRKSDNASEAALCDYIVFGDILAGYAEKSECLQFLSTVMKLMDNFCSMDADLFDAKNARLVRGLLDREESLVRKLEDKFR